MICIFHLLCVQHPSHESDLGDDPERKVDRVAEVVNGLIALVIFGGILAGSAACYWLDRNNECDQPLGLFLVIVGFGVLRMLALAMERKRMGCV